VTATTRTVPEPPTLRELLRLPPVERVLVRGDERDCDWREARPGQWYGNCPAHDDTQRSAALAEGDDGRALLRCFAGCPVEAMCDALDLPTFALNLRGRRSRAAERDDAERAQAAVRRSVALLNSPQLDVLREREGWTVEAIEAVGVGRYGPDRVTIPERDHRGRIVSTLLYVPRHARRRGLWPKGTEAGSTRAMVYRAGGPQSSTVLLVEGGPCVVSAMSLGWEAVGMPSAGIGVEPRWTRLLRDHGADVAADRLRAVIDAAEVIRGKRGRPAEQSPKAELYLQEALSDGECTPVATWRHIGPEACRHERLTEHDERSVSSHGRSPRSGSFVFPTPPSLPSLLRRDMAFLSSFPTSPCTWARPRLV